MKLSDLGRKSIRRNALIADLLHRITFIEKVGTGIKRMRDEAHDQSCPEPIFEENGFFTAIFYPNPEVRAQAAQGPETSTAQVTGQVAWQVTGQVAGQASVEVLKMLKIMSGEMTRAEIQAALGLKGRANFEERYLKPAMETDLIDMTRPDKPRSSKQRYRLTNKGRAVLEFVKEDK
ncbi:MAG: ATP-binding protein [Syntrophales bacterium]